MNYRTGRLTTCINLKLKDPKLTILKTTPIQILFFGFIKFTSSWKFDKFSNSYISFVYLA